MLLCVNVMTIFPKYSELGSWKNNLGQKASVRRAEKGWWGQTEMYNKMVVSEGIEAVEVLRKKCERWQPTSIMNCTMVPPQLMSSVLAERVNTIVSSMTKEMGVMDSRFSNELQGIKSAHDDAASTKRDIVPVDAFPIDTKTAAKLNAATEKMDNIKEIKSTISYPPKAGSTIEGTITNLAPRDKTPIRPASRNKSNAKPAAPAKTSMRSASQDKNLAKPATRSKIAKSVPQDKTIKGPASHGKTTTKPLIQDVKTTTGLAYRDKLKVQPKPNPVQRSVNLGKQTKQTSK
uniref:Uncharacterized protein n=1 Tax=Physcomitrium patens TaxID=3218 RepID=A0A2K1IIA4_PHYPA|nr:hypothetical protein PHYPA_027701 [Physcomitrium patens]